MERRLAAILAADVVGFSRLVGADEETTLTAFKSLRLDFIEPLIAEHRGRVVKLMGDGFLVEYQSAVDAVRCAISWQTQIRDHVGPTAFEFRIGINLGDIVVDGDDIHGEGVNIAARLEGLAEPGTVVLSDIVHQSVMAKLDHVFQDFGTHTLKNIETPVRVWQWPGGTSTHGSPITARPTPDKPSIAVLPFDNMSGDSEQEYFADGITEDIITEISRIHELMVIARNSSFTYKGKAAKVQDICRDLGVGYVLEGSVRKAGDRVRINAQLIDGRTGGHLWAERYDRELKDIFAVQDDVTERIVQALKLELVGAAKPGQQTDNPEAYDCVLRGREQYRLFTNDSNVAARELYQRAISLDPNYAEPYAGLAETYVQDWFKGDETALDRAYDLAHQAATRDPFPPLVQEALSTVHLFKKQHAEAIETARRWIKREPSNADAYMTLAGALHFSGENDKVIGLVHQAMHLNPYYPFFYPHYIGMANLMMRRYDEAIAALQRSIGLNSEVLWPHLYLAACYSYMGENTYARAQLAEVQRINPGFTSEWPQKFLPYKRREDLNFLIEGLRGAGLKS